MRPLMRFSWSRAAAKGMRVRLTSKGEDGPACLGELAALIANRFGESE